MSNFNPEQFMSTEIEGKGETDYTPIPEGEYDGVIKAVEATTTPKGSPLLELTWIVDDQEAREISGMAEPTVRQSIWLDITEAGALEFGPNKNIQLNRVREALGQNDGRPWAPNMLMGQVAKIEVKHDLLNDGRIMARVKGVRA